MAELDRLEALFGTLSGRTDGAVSPDETAHREIANRLAALTGLWHGLGSTTGTATGSGTGGPADTAASSVADSIEDADDDEIFAFIDERF